MLLYLIFGLNFCVFVLYIMQRILHLIQAYISRYVFTDQKSSANNPRANGAKRRSGRKPVARVTNSAIYTRVNANIAKCKVIHHVMEV